MFRGIMKVLYFVPDCQAAAAWYSRLFDITITVLDNPNDFFINVGGQAVWFHQADEQVPSGAAGPAILSMTRLANEIPLRLSLSKPFHRLFTLRLFDRLTAQGEKAKFAKMRIAAAGHVAYWQVDNFDTVVEHAITLGAMLY